MRVLVTGGAGFIGANLVRALVQSGTDVVVLDDLSTGSKENLREVDAEPWFRARPVTLLEFHRMTNRGEPCGGPPV